MAREQITFNLNSTITLASSITSTSTTIIASTTTGLPTTPNYRISIDSEIIFVTVVFGTTLTVIRGIESTIATSHLIRSGINFLPTAGMISQLFLEKINSGLYSAASPQSGDVYFCTDAPLIFNNSNIFRFKPRLTLFPSSGSGFSWVNQATSTLTTSNGVTFLQGNNTDSTGYNLRAYVQSAPVTPYKVDLGYNLYSNAVAASTFSFGGIIFRDSNTGKSLAFGNAFTTYPYATQIPNSLRVLEYSSPTSGLTAYFLTNFDTRNYYIIRFEDDGTNHNFYISPDGVNFFKIFSTSRITYLANPNQIGIFIDPTYTGSTVSIGIYHYLIH